MSFDWWRPWFGGKPRPWLNHAASPLSLPTYDGSGQATHPDVLDFGLPWQGHRYWMVMTPFPNLDSAWENPSILVSADGLDWQVPLGVTNPLVATPTEGFHADPDMIFHPEHQEIWLFYLWTIRGQTQSLCLLRSTDGRHWAGPEVLLSLPYQTIRSPAVAWRERRFYLWSVNMSGGRCMERRESADGRHWSAPRRVDFHQPGYTPSHLEVVFSQDSQRFWMVVQAEPQGGGGQELFWAESLDGLAWRTHSRPLLDLASAPAWARRTLYRTSMVADGEGLRLWYSGRDEQNGNWIAPLAVSSQLFLKLRRAYE